MPTEIKMPQLGESITEGTVGRWLKQPGEMIGKYESILEVITDKVDSEVPSPVAGTLLDIFVTEGATVPVGTVLAILGDPAEKDQQHATSAATTITNGGEPVGTQPVAVATPDARPQRLSPVVAKLVAEHNLDVSHIQGTGAGGRVSKRDVLRFLAQAQAATPPPPVDVPPAAEDRIHTPIVVVEPLPRTEIQRPVVGEPAASRAAAPTPDQALLPDDVELVPLTPMRRLIAEHMLQSVRTAPHVTTFVDIDLSRIVAHREKHQADFERQGTRLTFMPYFVQATVAALQAVPVINGRFTDEGILIHRRIHIGVAVALDEGLVVPVIPNADDRNVLGLARSIGDLAERARTRRLRPDETYGGTFTITNHGNSGSLLATPIINQPQAGILGIGAIQKRPVVVTQNGVDALAIKPMCYCSLTFDHRVCDGATGDAFLMTVKRTLEEYG